MKRRAALLVVDVQMDFCPGGALPVPEGDRVVPVLNHYIEMFWKRGSPIFASRDWHPLNSQHFKASGGKWPTHCVQGSLGAHFHSELILPMGTVVVSKGMAIYDNGYSALQGVTENGTPLAMLLRRMELDRIYVGGLATDYCVQESVLDALKEGFSVTLLTDAIRGVDLERGDSERAIARMVAAGAELADLKAVRAQLEAQNNGAGI
jgi:nicotinamidase/pyrazinamidase